MNSGFIDKLSILYVEDEDAIRERLSRFLQRRTQTLYQAANGREGLEMFHEYKPDIVITDIRMPVMDGLSMAEQIREADHDIPIIITTGHNDEEFFLRSIDIGIDKYVKKPINFKEFIQILLRTAKTVIQQKEIEAKNEFIKTVLDINPQLILITDGERISYLNQSFLDFIGCTSIEEFSDRFGSIDYFLVEEEGSFYKNKNFAEWVNYAIKDQSGQLSVVMTKDFQNRSREDIDKSTFMLTVNQVPSQEEWLLSFSDVTRIEEEKQLYRVLSLQDHLTGIYNRKKFYDELSKEIDRVNRYQQKLSVIMFDVDHFKSVNDTYGHQVGDKVLQDISQIVRRAIRKTDVFARYGGEEFTLLMPGTHEQGAVDIAERLRREIEEYRFAHGGGVTCSFGVAEIDHNDDSDTFVKKADVALYNAKENGRNRVEVFRTGGFSCIK
ncbi:GGDEF domain-containing response regulator [Limisalsivibrio acetivorans]|uniref:GGDEF domain-containing response regulator n=1 Tax=Limisalsivibrio acetivorans TaxID=1304888 RepID=UPI0003B798FF|nr:diguanylate cyclase [Limisalsivibrio acetivorans]